MKRSRSQKAGKKKKRPDSRIETAVMDFVQYHPVRRLSTNLRAMLIDFLMTDGATEAGYLQDLLYDLGGLFELLDVLESECKTDIAK